MQLLPWGYFPLARVFSFSQKFSGTPLSIRGKISSHSGEESHNRRPASMFHVVRGSLGFLLRPPPAETDISARICSTSPLQSLSGSSRFSFGFELCSTFVHTEKKKNAWKLMPCNVRSAFGFHYTCPNDLPDGMNRKIFFKTKQMCKWQEENAPLRVLLPQPLEWASSL